MTRQRYDNDPIQEALCEVRFAPGQEWNLTLPGHLHEALKKADYTGRPRQQNIIAANLIAPQGAPPEFAVAQGLGRVQFPTEDGTRLVATGPDVLSVHVLKPYPGWEDFRRRIVEAVDAYQRVTSPSGIRRIGLRYLNRVELPLAGVALDEFFTCGVTTFEDPSLTTTAFMHRTEYVYQDDIRLVLTFASLEGPEGSSAFILDLDLIWEAVEEPMPIEKMGALIDDLRSREREAFEKLITNKLRAVFKPKHTEVTSA